MAQDEIRLTGPSGAYTLLSSNGIRFTSSSDAYTLLATSRPATLQLRDDLDRTIFYLASHSGILTLGGGDTDGKIWLLGSDGATTNIESDGADARISLGAIGEDGDIELRNNAGTVTVLLDGQSGEVRNELDGDGLIKAWAKINGDGTILGCWRCNTSTSATKRFTLGLYLISFSPLGADIRGRPRMAVLDSNTTIATASGMIDLSHHPGDTATIRVKTTDVDGNAADRPFTLFVY